MCTTSQCTTSHGYYVTMGTWVLRHMGTTSYVCHVTIEYGHYVIWVLRHNRVWVLGYYVTWVLCHNQNICVPRHKRVPGTVQSGDKIYWKLTSQTSSRNCSAEVYTPPQEQSKQQLAMCWRHNQLIKYNGNWRHKRVPGILLAEVYTPPPEAVRSGSEIDVTIEFLVNDAIYPI